MEINAREFLHYKNRYNAARRDLLIIIAFTVINCFATLTNTYFLFSAFIPMAFMQAALYIRSDEFFADVPEMELQEFSQFADVIGFIFIAIAVIGIVLYLMCWLFSKKRRGWLVVALVLFSLDTAFLLLNFEIGVIVDVLFHGYIIYSLVTGVIASRKLRTLEEYGVEEPAPEFANESVASFADQLPAEEQADNTNQEEKGE